LRQTWRASCRRQRRRTAGERSNGWATASCSTSLTPARAILGGLEIVEETERAISISARVGINAGAVIAQEGDYFGRTVNIAARIADYARPREVLVSEEARLSAGVEEVDFELIGDVPLKGVSRAVRLHKAVRAAT
jgi:adenylate cyclase